MYVVVAHRNRRAKRAGSRLNVRVSASAPVALPENVDWTVWDKMCARREVWSGESGHHFPMARLISRTFLFHALLLAGDGCMNIMVI